MRVRTRSAGAPAHTRPRTPRSGRTQRERASERRGTHKGAEGSWRSTRVARMCRVPRAHTQAPSAPLSDEKVVDGAVGDRSGARRRPRGLSIRRGRREARVGCQGVRAPSRVRCAAHAAAAAAAQRRAPIFPQQLSAFPVPAAVLVVRHLIRLGRFAGQAGRADGGTGRTSRTRSSRAASSGGCPRRRAAPRHPLLG